MVKILRSPTPPASLVAEKEKANGSHRCEDVVKQLVHDFHNKCYICELKGLQDPEVEHLIPHENDKYHDLRFDWNNLFLSCGHCNGNKNNGEYARKVIDCTTVDPEDHIDFQFSSLEEIIVKAKNDSESSVMTTQLINNAFNMRNTGIRFAACDQRAKDLSKEMTIFFRSLIEYENDPSGFSRQAVAALLDRASAFAAFKRSYIRSRLDHYSEFAQYLA